VDFYIDGNFYASIDKPPFRIQPDLHGEHLIKAIAYNGDAEAWHERKVEI